MRDKVVRRMELKDLIAQEARKIDTEMRRDLDGLTGLDPLLREILDYGLFGGGKRIRPLLAILCARVCGSTDARVYRLAAAFEYLHAATLFHDDVIDRADTRRGRESINSRYGMVGAILAGDFLHAQAMAIVGAHGGREGLSVFVEATRAMVDGEFVQLRNARNYEQSEGDYLSVIMGKTALLIGAACEIGGIFARADEVHRSALRTYGVNLGCAFQIVDDLLDYLGDGRKTGKAIGNDLAEGKMTLPLILALQRADAGDRETLGGIMRDERQRKERFAEVKRLLEKHGGFAGAREKAQVLIAEASGALSRLPQDLDPESLDMLRDLSRYVVQREH